MLPWAAASPVPWIHTVLVSCTIYIHRHTAVTCFSMYFRVDQAGRDSQGDLVLMVQR